MTAADLAELLVDAASAVLGGTLLGLLLAGTSELAGFWRDLLERAVRW